jgi:hypothetical protein
MRATTLAMQVGWLLIAAPALFAVAAADQVSVFVHSNLSRVPAAMWPCAWPESGQRRAVTTRGSPTTRVVQDGALKMGTTVRFTAIAPNRSVTVTVIKGLLCTRNNGSPPQASSARHAETRSSRLLARRREARISGHS